MPQGFQTLIEPFVIPAVIVLGLLLGFLLVVYFVVLGFHVRRRRKLGLKRSHWREKLEAYLVARLDPVDIQVGANDERSFRDFLLALVTEYPSKIDELADLYEKLGYLSEDLSRLNNRRWHIRARALNRLRVLRKKEVRDFLPRLLQDKRLPVRLTAVATWGDLGNPDLEQEVATILSRHDKNLQQFFHINLFSAGLSIESLTDLAHREQSQSRKAAAILLGRSGEAEGLEVLRSLLDDSSPEVRREVALALGRLETGVVLDKLEVASNDSRAEIRAAAAYSLGRIENFKALEILSGLVADTSAQVRLNAFLSMSNYGSEGREKINSYRNHFPKLAKEANLLSYSGGGSAH